MIKFVITDQLNDPDQASRLVCQSFNYLVTTPQLTSNLPDHVFEHEKVKYLIGLTTTTKAFIQAYNQEQLIGLTVLNESNLQRLWDLTWLCVDPEYQRQGIGSVLVTQAQAWAQQRQVGLILTTDYPDFYTRLGFSINAPYRTGWSIMVMPCEQADL